MLKAQAFRRGFSLWTRAPPSQIIRSAARSGHQTVRVQRLRIVKPLLSRSLLKYLDIDDDGDEEEHTVQTSSRERGADDQTTSDDDAKAGEWVTVGEDEEGEEDIEALLFLPTGLSRAKPRTFYKGSDPEWQEFVRIGRDRELKRRIQNEVARDVRLQMAVGLKGRLGKIDTERGMQWFDFIFPSGPPLEYERPGIEVREDLSVHRTTRPVDQFVHQKINNLLTPAGAVTSVYAHATEKATKHWKTLKSAAGFQSAANNESGSSSKFQITGSASDGSKPTAAGSSLQPSTGSAPTSPTETAPSQQSIAPAGLSAASQGNMSSGPINDLFGRFSPSLPSSLPPSSDLLLDLSTFRKTYKRTPLRIDPPRGTCVIQGMMKVIGTRAVATMDVTALYDPATGKHIIVRLQARHIIDRVQRPLGGRGSHKR